MAVGLSSRWQIKATLVANEFIDRFMVPANGEYIKVYLFLLRHQDETGAQIEVSTIAEALNHTEADVKRAMAYWERQGILVQRGSGQESQDANSRQADQAAPKQSAAAMAQGAAAVETAVGRADYKAEQVQKLAGDEEFTQLLYIAQQYRKKPMTPTECQAFAYLYDGLHLSVELLEYIVEYCVSEGHTSVRYMETVALNWHQKGLTTVNEAKAYASGFSKDSFAVMKALGLTGRAPASEEKNMMDKWFRVYGFSRELVLEACNRTINAIHTPSFEYADKILTDWKNRGVKGLEDVAKQDEEYKAKKAADKASKTPGGKNTKKGADNRFHNFDQRSYDYDELMQKIIFKEDKSV